MDGRESIFAALVAYSPDPVRDLPEPFPARPAGATWDEFAKTLETLGGRIATLGDLAQFQDRPAWIDDDAATLLHGLSFPAPENIWEAEIGITTADWAIAETGTLVISAGAGKSRLTSLAPPFHVVLIRADRLLGTLEEAMDRFSDRTTVMVTGTSRTADIEGILVRGVHGPRDLWVVLLPPADGA